MKIGLTEARIQVKLSIVHLLFYILYCMNCVRKIWYSSLSLSSLGRDDACFKHILYDWISNIVNLNGIARVYCSLKIVYNDNM